MRLPGLLQYLIIAIATIPLAAAVFLLAALGRRRAAYAPIRGWCRVASWVSGVRYRVRGLENLPPDGRYVVISNHSSHVDGPVLILALPEPIYFVIKQELTRVPIWGWTVLRVGFIPIDRSDSQRARDQMRAAADTVRAGRVVLVFPEGTRAPHDGMLPFKKGGFHLAVDAGVPIVPVAVNRSRRLMPKGVFAPRAGEAEVVVCEPIATAGYDKDRIGELAERTRRAIAAARRADPDFAGDPDLVDPPDSPQLPRSVPAS